ncbi:protein Gawky isoform X2 [Tetranychus urticae]|uniref:protein Gawky isoform X2 n=1 Tax=Tetranychus urticae TaxID=32264 RepID=UPI00077BC1B3|nr:protein Gawky isoform X2 [Tetranychus urticae]
MWQNDDNKMEMNQGWNIPNRGDDKNSDQQQKMDADNEKLSFNDNLDELLGAIGGCDNFMGTGSKMTNNNNSGNINNTSDNNSLSFNSGPNCDDGDDRSFPNYNFTSGNTFNNHSERSQDGLSKNEGWPSIGSHRGESSLNCGGLSANSMNNDSGWGCASQQLQQNQFQQQQKKQSSNTQSNNQGAPASSWGSSAVSKGSGNRNWLNDSNIQDEGSHMIRENDYSYGSHHNSAVAMTATDGEGKPVPNDYLKDAALFSDDWGKTVINQEKAWDLPPSLQSSPNESSSLWSTGSITGTEIWEYTVRNKTKALISVASAASSSSSAAPIAATPTVSTNQKVSQQWGHNSASHIGGTWGEEEDSSNVWTGVPSGVSATAPMASGGASTVAASVINASNNHSVPSESDPCSDNAASIWGSSTKVNNGNGALVPNNVVNVSNSSVVGNFGGPMATGSNLGIVNPSGVGMKRDNINTINSNSMKSSCSSSASSGSGSGSINIGTWGTSQGGFNKNNESIQPTGWDNDEENARKRIPPASSGNVDDGTAVWGKPEQHNKIARWKDPANNAKIPGNSANGNNALASQSNKNGAGSGITSPSPGMIRLPPGTPGLKGINTNKGNSGSNNNNQNKQVNGLTSNLMSDGGDVGEVGGPANPSSLGTDIWNKPSNRGWSDNQNSNSKNNQMPIGGFGWGQKQSENGTPKTTPGTPNTPGGNIAGNWGQDVGPTSPLSYWGSKGRTGGANNWLTGDESLDVENNWNKNKQGMPSQQPPQISKEMLNSSKVYRLLMEMGCKKEDIENALRSSGLSKEDFNDLARAFSMRDSMNEMDLRGKDQVSSNTPTSLLLNTGLVNSSLSSIMNRNPSQGMQQNQPQVTLSSHQTPDHIINVQQSTSQQQHDQSQIHHQLNQAPSQALPSINHVQNVLRNQAAKNLGSGQPNLPSEKQLMHLVQQIQLAVQSGHLNAQILNQPLALPTIHLINQLLQNIKTLQQLQLQIASHPKNGGPFNNSSQSNLHVQITQTKLRIQNLQNQITIQQGLFLKQQQQQGQMTGGPTHSQPNVMNSQASLVNQTALIYSQSNGDIGGNGGAQNQSQQLLASAQSSHAQSVHHSGMVSNIGNSNSIPPVFNANHGSGNGAGMDFLKDNDSIQLNSDFRDLSLKDFVQSGAAGAHQGLGISSLNGGMNALNVANQQGHQQQQGVQQGNGGQHQHSRLKTWKFSNMDRVEHGSSGSNNSGNNDFLRAPGSSKHHLNESGLNRGNTSDNGSGIGGWSGLNFPGNANDGSNWSKDSMMNAVSIASNTVPSSVMRPNSTQSGDLKSLVMSSSSSVTGGIMTAPSQTTVNNLDLNDINNLVPEFEPGKPWKGVSGMKIEDDPHITPGSVTRSPLSVNTIRDPAILTGLYNNWSAKGASPTSMNSDILAPSVGLSSNATWAFNTNANAGWGAIPNETPNNEVLWSGSMTKTRGPPPGLGQERLGPRGDQSMAGIRPQSNSYGNWMMNPSNEGDHLSNGGLESKDLLFSRMMNNTNGMGFGMGVNIGNKWM